MPLTGKSIDEILDDTQKALDSAQKTIDYAEETIRQSRYARGVIDCMGLVNKHWDSPLDMIQAMNKLLEAKP